MLLYLYTIIALLVFIFMVLSGSVLDAAIVKSAVTFSALVLVTGMARFICRIISNSVPAEMEKDMKTGEQ